METDQEETLDDLDHIITRGLDYAVAKQKSDGSWSGDVHAGAQSTALFIVTLYYLGILDDKYSRGALAFISTWQLDDGSFEDFPGANTGGVEATSIVLAGLIAMQVPANAPILVNTRKWLDAKANENNTTPRAYLYLSLVGETDAVKIFAPPVYIRLVPGIDGFLGKRLQIFMVLASYCQSVIKQGLLYPDFFSDSSKLRASLKKRYLNYFTQIQSPCGSWAGAMESTAWTLMALKALGLESGDALYDRGVASLKHYEIWDGDQFKVSTFYADVWNTATLTKVLLLAQRESDHAVINSSLELLVKEQAELPMPKVWQRPVDNMPRSGGWAFECDNPFGQDPDSSAAVLHTLAMANKYGYKAANKECIESGLNWVLGMQNSDGGWPAFTYGQKSKPPGPKDVTKNMPPKGLINIIRYTLNPPVLYADPSYEDISGRVLSTLSFIDDERLERVISNAYQFLKSQLANNNVWWGHWEVCYVLSTAYIIDGLIQSGMDTTEPLIVDAITWLLSHQNQDGGWGETPKAYFDEAMAGVGPSSEELTGKVVVALIAAGKGEDIAVKGAVKWLIRRQRTSGEWVSGVAVGTIIPANALYANPWYSHYCALEALVCYSNHIKDKKH